jgi:hypothetical protein
MSDPQPVSYYVQPLASADDGHLQALAICHYIWGALVFLFSCVFIVHIVMGTMMLRGSWPGGSTASSPPPSEMGYLFVGMGSCGMLLGWLTGILTIASGRCIRFRQKRVFSLVMAGVNCGFVPFGTVLGVFTFILLARPAVIDQYARPAP